MRIRWKTIARVVKTHAKSGEVVVESVHGLPPLLQRGMHVALIPPELSFRRYLEVEDAGEPTSSSQLVSFKGITSIGDAEMLVNKEILARVDELPHDFALLDRESLMGMDVTDRTLGLLGTVSAIMSGPDQDVYVLDTDAGEILVPVRDEFVVGFDGDVIELDLPEGVVLLEGE